MVIVPLHVVTLFNAEPRRGVCRYLNHLHSDKHHTTALKVFTHSNIRIMQVKTGSSPVVVAVYNQVYQVT